MRNSTPGGLRSSCRLRFFRRFDGSRDLFAVTGDNRIEFLLNFTEDARRIDAGKIPVDMLVHNLDER